MNRRTFFATIIGGAAAATIAPLVPSVPIILSVDCPGGEAASFREIFIDSRCREMIRDLNDCRLDAR